MVIEHTENGKQSNFHYRVVVACYAAINSVLTENL
jgi:hypothetical protein